MGYTFNPEEFHMGMNVEMEHQDVTNGNVVKTAKIAAAHLTEKPNYYTLLKKYVEKKKLNEYSEEEKRKIGIPLSAVSRGGVWYIGNTYAGKVVNGKFVAAGIETDPNIIRVPKGTTGPGSQTSTGLMLGTGRIEIQKGEPLVPIVAPDKLSSGATVERNKQRNQEYAELLGTTYNPSGWLLPKAVEQEARTHGQLIHETIRQELAASEKPRFSITEGSIGTWLDSQIFNETEARRNTVWKTFDALIENNNLRITSVDVLYRAFHFFTSPSTGENQLVLFKQLMDQLQSGTVELPPSSFSPDLGIAIKFARFNDPVKSIVFKLLPPKKGFRGVHLSEVSQNVAYKYETEVVLASSKYKVSSITEREIFQDETDKLRHTTYTVELEQLEK